MSQKSKVTGGIMPQDTELVRIKGYYVELNKKIDKDKALESALKKLKRMIKDNELMLEMQRIQQYTKPSAIKRDKKAKAKARQRHETRRQSL
jgi:ribosomal protein S21